MTGFQTGRAVARLRAQVRRFLHDRRGGVSTLVALAAPVVIGAMGMGGEIGYWYLSQQRLQNAADVAAHGAALRLKGGDGQAAIQTMAEALAVRAEIDLATSTVAANMPPSQGAFIEDSGAVEVVVTQTVPRLFSAIYDNTPLQLSARAVARLDRLGQACVLALNGSAAGAIQVGGSTTVTAVSCELVTNSTAANAFLQFGSGSLAAGCVRSSGGAVTTANATLDCGTPEVSQPSTADPFAALAEPTIVGNCENGNVGQNNQSTTISPSENHSSGMSAIRFCNGLKLRGDVTLEPGLYMIEGGDFVINANATVAGSGVTFFLDDDVEIVFNGSSVMNLSAPTAGTFAGILVFGSRSATGVTHKINGNSGATLDGAIYTPASDIDYLGNNSTSSLGCTQIVADEVRFSGNSGITVHCLFPPAITIPVGGEIALVE